MRPRVEIEHRMLTMPVPNHQVKAILLVDGPDLISDVPMLVDVVELKARKVRFIQAMKLVMLAPKTWWLIPWDRKK